MSTLKKILALSLALAMILSVSVFAGYTTDSYKDAAAIDADAAESVELLYALKVMTGDEKGNFNPNATITRAEVAKMIYVILNYGKDDKATAYAAANLFTDVPATAWYAGYINYLAALGLVNGSEGKFYPTAAVKTAEAAKMLLTAIGYNATDRQYTGANWAKNVLSDASIVGLLGGYKADINGAAPRQWVAVMFANALLDAYTYETVVPSGFNGIFNTAASGANFVKFGYKYYELYDAEVYAYATATAYIDQYEWEEENKYGNIIKHETTYAGKGKVLFSDGNEFKSTGLGYMDLGQKYRVIASDNVALSVRPVTSVVADASVAEFTYDFAYNKGDSTREFTIGDMTAPFTSSKINSLTNAAGNSKVAAAKMTETELKNKQNKLSNDMIRAIDRNGDGEIDYIIETVSDYAYVEKAATDKSGDYVILGYTDDSTSGKLWLGGAVDCDEELVAGNFVKRTWNQDNGNYDLEVLPAATEVKYTKKTGAGATAVYTIGDEEYQLASKGFTVSNDMYELKNEKIDVVYDGGLAVYAGKHSYAYTDIEDVYEQLAVLKKELNMNSSIDSRINVTGAQYYDINGELVANELADEKYASRLESPNRYHLFAIETKEDGSIVPTCLVPYTTVNQVSENVALSVADVRDALNTTEDVIGDFAAGFGKLDAKKGTFKMGDNGRTRKIDADAKFFVIRGSKKNVTVETISEFDAKTYAHVYAELFYSPADKNGNITVIGGLLDMTTQTYDAVDSYLFVLETGEVYPVNSNNPSKGYNFDLTVQFADGTEDITLHYDQKTDAEKALKAIKVDALYAYTYNAGTDVYTLGTLAETADGFDFDEEHFTDKKTGWEITEDSIAKTCEYIIQNANNGTPIVKTVDEDECVIALTIKSFGHETKELKDVKHFFVSVADWEETLGVYSIVNGKVVDAEDVESFVCYSDFMTVQSAMDGTVELVNICIYANDDWTNQ